MSIPAWILDIFAAVMLLVAAVSAGQLVVARAWTRAGMRDADIAGSHLLMGIAMAGMLVASLSTLPNAAWVVIFAVMTAWFAWYLWRETRGRGAGALASGHHAPHLVHSAAMLYMFAALAGPASGSGAGMAGMAAGSAGATQSLHAPTLALVFALLLIAYSVRDVDRKACADGYFHVVGRRFTPAGPALATALAGATSRGAPTGSASGGDSAVATMVAPKTAPTEMPPGGPVAGQVTASPAERLLLSPAVVKGCRVAMGVTMAFMLLIMI
jgi:uncharacterized membrane protein YfcA